MKRLILVLFLMLMIPSLAFGAYTTDKCTGGTASAISVFSGYLASHAFDNIETKLTGWVGANGSIPGWVKYDFGSGVAWPITRVRVLGWKNSYISTSYATSVKIEGSNNDSNWTTLVASSSTPTYNTWYTIDFSNTTDYRYIKVTALSTDFPTYPGFTEIEMMYEPADNTVIIFFNGF